MEFFNKKEEVLEVVLTQKGKELFASGSLKPHYYSFFDNDIVYESKFSEEQNDIVPRIKATPTLKQNTSVYDNSSNAPVTFNSQKLYCELGSKTLNDQYKPAWQLDFVKSPQFQYVGNRNDPIITKNFQVKFSSSIDNNNANQEIIPQFDIQTVYYIAKIDNDYYLVKDYPILFNVMELNSFENNEKQEYDIEAYLVKDKQVEQLSFNDELKNNIYQYVNILFDNQADFKEKINTKDIYGDMVEKDESNC